MSADPFPGAPRAVRHEVLVGGALTGAVAAAVMALCICSMAAAEGYGFLAPLRAMGAVLSDAQSVEAGGGARAALGLALHLGTSMFLAIVFLSVVPRDFPTGSATIVAVAYGLAAACTMAAYVLPSVNPVLRAEMPEMGGSWVIAYATFGAALGLGPSIRRRLSRPAAPPRERALAGRRREVAAAQRRAGNDRSADLYGAGKERAR